MSTYSLQVPEGLMPIHCERPGSEYSDVPIWYMTLRISGKDVRMTSIRLPDGNKIFVTVYSDENTEMYLRMLQDHDNLVTQIGSKKCIQDAEAILRKAISTYKTTKEVVNPTPERIALGVTQKKDWRAAQRTCREITAAAFSLFRRMLDGTAKEQWDMIDNEVHNDSTHTDLQGLTVEGPRSRTWTTFELCIEKHKLHVFKTDTLAQDWQNKTPWQTQYRMTSEQKNQTETHKLLTELEAKNNSEEDEIYPLTIEKAMDQTRKEKDTSTKKESTAKPGKNGKSSEKHRSNGPSDSYHIPKKQRTDKFCNRCKDNGGAHTTHNTNDCNRYKADGTPNKEYGAKSNFAKKGKEGKDKSYKKGGWDKKSISHLTAELDSVKKQLKKIKRSRGKKRKRHGRHHQSSDSDSSGSDSE
jgi:hypothetical protein